MPSQTYELTSLGLALCLVVGLGFNIGAMAAMGERASSFEVTAKRARPHADPSSRLTPEQRTRIGNSLMAPDWNKPTLGETSAGNLRKWKRQDTFDSFKREGRLKEETEKGSEHGIHLHAHYLHCDKLGHPECREENENPCRDTLYAVMHPECRAYPLAGPTD